LLTQRSPILSIALLWLCCAFGCASVKSVREMEQERDAHGLVRTLITPTSGKKRSERLQARRVKEEAGKALVRLGGASVPQLMLALKNAPPDERAGVAQALALIKPHGVDALLGWAESNQEQLDRSMARAVASTGDPRAVPALAGALEQCLDGGKPGRAERLALHLGQIRDPSAAAVLIDAWSKTSSPRVHVALLNGLGLTGASAGLKLAATALADPDEEVRLAAAVALGRLGSRGVESVVRLFNSNREQDQILGRAGVLAAGAAASVPLVERLGVPPQRSVEVLARLADSVALYVTGRGISYELHDRMGRVVQVLADGLPATALGLARAFDRPRPETRRAAAQALGLLQATEGVSALALATIEDADELVRADAAMALSLICDEMSIVAEICRARREGSRGQQAYTAGELERRLGGQTPGSALHCDVGELVDLCRGKALPALAAAARDPSVRVRVAAARALIQLTLGGALRGDALLVDTLKLLAGDEKEEVRFEAEQGMRSLDDL